MMVKVISKNIFLGLALIIYLVFCQVLPGGAVQLSAPVDIPGGHLLSRGDMNGDGVSDLVRIAGNRGSDVLSVALSDNGGWQLLSGLAISRDVYDLALADMNGDTFLDVVVAFVGEDSGSSGLQVFLNDGSGALSAQTKLAGTGYRRLACADFDGDGNMDVAAASYPSTNVVVVYGEGSGLFTEIVYVMGQNGQGGLAVADLNGDELPDIVAADDTSIVGYSAQEIRVLLNDGTRTWGGYVSYTVGTTPRHPVVGDFTGDGWDDVVVSAGDQLFLLANDGAGGLGTPISILTLTATSGPIAVGDMDSDGYLDLVGTTAFDLYVLPGCGAGAFGSSVWFSNELNPGSFRDVVVGDLDGSGRLDVATVNVSTTRVWSGIESGVYSFAVTPSVAKVNLGTSLVFDYLVLNATEPTSNMVTWSVDEGSFSSIYSSNRNKYTAPALPPASGGATVTANRAVSTDTATAAVSFTEYEFVQGLGLNGVKDVVFNPSDSLIMYVATASGVQISQDGGRTSMPLGTGLTAEVRALAITETSGQPVLLAATMLGLYRYELEFGTAAVWAPVAGGVLPSTTLMLGSHGSTVYAGRWYNPSVGESLYKSSDGGLTWTALTFNSRDVGHVWLVDADYLYVSHRDGLAYSADGGTSWQERGTELLQHDYNDGVLVGGLVFDPANPEIMVAGLKESMIPGTCLFSSTNGGQSWEPAWNIPVSKVFSIASDPLVSATLYLLGDSGLWKSVDRGINWWKIGNGLPLGVTYYTVKVCPEDGDFVYAGFSSGLYASGFRDGSGLGAPGIEIAEPLKNLSLGSSYTFSATAIGLPDPSVTWAVVSGGGSINPATGAYTAPTLMPADGKALLQATAVADNNRSGLIEVWLMPALDTAGLSAPADIVGGVIVRYGDMDGDGVGDLVRIASSRVSEVLSVALSDGGDWQVLSGVAISRDVMDVALADMDGDGALDVVVAFNAEDSAASGLQVFLNDGSGGLTPQVKFAGTSYRKIVCADFNGDGKMDVAAATWPASNVLVVHGDGSGHFTDIVSVMGQNGQGGLAVADMNGDGRPDLLAADDLVVLGTPNYYSEIIRVVLNAGNGAWSAYVDYEVGAGPRHPVVGDFTGDGWADVVVSAASQLYLLENDGAGGLGTPVSILTLNATPGSIAVGHMDSDGSLDLVGTTASDLFMLPGSGVGGFGSPLWFSNELNPGSFRNAVVGNLDGDGRMDVATANGSLTRVWSGSDTGIFSFTVRPSTAIVNIDTSLIFDCLVLNADEPTNNMVTWGVDEGSFGSIYSSNRNQYTAPVSLPASSGATVTATRAASADTAIADVSFTEYDFVQALGLNGVKVQDIIFDPDDSRVIYAATASGVYRSADGGQTATCLGVGFTAEIRALALTETSGQPVLLACKKYGLYRYELNQGTAGSWVSSSGGGVLPNGNLTLAAQGLTVYAAGWSNTAQADILYKSLDGGVSWSATTFSSRDIGKIWLVDAGHLYVSHKNGLAYSADGGITWQERGLELAKHDINDGVVVGGLAIDPSNPAFLLAGLKESMIYGASLFRSDDGGESWEPAGNLPASKVVAIAIDPVASATLYLLGDSGMWKSVDWGHNWWQVGNGLLAYGSYYYTVKISPFDSQAVFAGLSTGIYASAFVAPPPPATLEVGTSGFEFSSIGDALTVAVDGDTVLVHPGTYLENLDLIDCAVTIKSVSGSAETVIDGGGVGSVVSFTGCNDGTAVLEGFSLINGVAAAGNSGGGIYCSDSDPLIRDCYIYANFADGYGGGIYLDGAAPKIINCRISANQATISGGGIYAENSSAVTLVNTVVSRNLSGSTVDAAAVAFNSSSGILTHCTIVDNSMGGVFVDSLSQLEMINSIVWGNGPGELDQLIVNGPDPDAKVAVSSSDIQGGYAGIDNIHADPLFVFGASYGLSSGSPCIGLADISLLPADDFDLDDDGDLGEALPVDIEDDLRVNGMAPDIGADEFCPQGLLAQYSNGVELSERIIYHGHSGNCSSTSNNLYQGVCTPLADSPVDWAWGYFSVAWSGYLCAPVSGTYTFSSNYWVDGTVFVQVGDTVIADFDTGGGGYSGQVELQVDSYTPVTISFASNHGSNNMVFGWRLPGQSWELVPAVYLSPEIYDFNHDDDVDGQDLADTVAVLEFGLEGFAHRFGLGGIR